MTNAEIILQERIRLMNSGVLCATEEEMEITSENGEIITIKEPEEIHTPGSWKALGFVPIVTETAITCLNIWKKKPGSRALYQAPAYFFKSSQVEPIEKEEPRLTRNWYVGQKIYWRVEELGAERYIRAVIQEVYPTHAIARTEANAFENYNGMNLWIDADTERDFY